MDVVNECAELKARVWALEDIIRGLRASIAENADRIAAVEESVGRLDGGAASSEGGRSESGRPPLTYGPTHAFDVYYDVVDKQYRVFCPPGCLYLGKTEVPIDNVEENGVKINVDGDTTVYCHVVITKSEDGGKSATATVDTNASDDDAAEGGGGDATERFTFSVAKICRDAPWNDEQYVTGTVFIASSGDIDLVSGDDSNVKITERDDGKTAIDVYYV